MRDKENIRQLCELAPDFIGFIFYPKSKRYVGDKIDNAILNTIPESIQKTGVFVNEDIEKLKELVAINKLNAVQLHGDESPEYCSEIKKSDITTIKAFRVNNDFNFSLLERYKKSIDYFLFDTYTEQYGGSGKKFNWEILNNYDYVTPFFLSGGISIEDVNQIKLLKGLNIYALDINSKFEIEPALKDINKVKTFINRIRNE